MISQFAEQLVSLDYSVTVIRTATDLRLQSLQSLYKQKIVYALYTTKDTGVTRRDCNAGYVFIREDGDFTFDFFVGGSKYGIHKNSYASYPSFECWSKDFPVDLLLDFLS